MRAAALVLLAACQLAAAPADWIVTARYVVTMDAQRRVIEDGAIAIRGENILAVGPRAEIERDYQPRRRIRRPDALLAPGLINTHTHAPMSLLRGIADDRRLQDWLENFIFPAEARNVTPEFVRWGTLLAAMEMLLSGTTTYTDMYYFEDTIAEATKQAGMRGVLGQTVIGFPAPDAKTPGEGLQRAEAFLRRWTGDPLIVPAVAPHAIYTTADGTLREARALANRYGAPLLIHVSETRQEVEEARAKRGMSPVQALDNLGVFSGRTVAAHMVWAEPGDLEILKTRNAGVAHCPSSNMKLASGIAPVARMLSLGLNVGLGPDGVAGSNNDFNLFEEMDLAAKLQKVATGDAQAVRAEQALEMATIGGARALGLDSMIGSLEAGKRADWISVDLSGAHAAPLYDVYSQMVYALKGSDVSDVMIHGRLVVERRRLLTLDGAQILRRAGQYRSRILSSLEE